MDLRDNIDPLELLLRNPSSQEAIAAGRKSRFEHGETPQ
jgi:hypothetical protein